MRPADGMNERGIHRILAAALVATVQNCMVNFDLWVLYLKGHHVQNMRQLTWIWHKYAAVCEPRLDVTRADDWPRIAPAIAVHVAIA